MKEVEINSEEESGIYSQLQILREFKNQEV